MFQFLVSYGGWPEAGRASAFRLLRGSDDAVVARFKPGGNLDLDSISRLPAMFMSEEKGEGEQCARIGHVRRIRPEPKNGYLIDYTFDRDFASISMAQMHELAVDLGIARWEFTESHWAIKDADLFEAVLRNGAARRPVPKVFDLIEGPVNHQLVAVMMPFDARYSGTYVALQSAASNIGMTCRRADDIWVHDHVLQDIIHLLCAARVVVADVTGRNPNVFYEAGIAHALGRDVILITQQAEDVPFDLRHLRYVTYLPNTEGLAKLAEDVRARLVTLTGL
jgi:hypothetical protein